jgi:REP element-mobilizing transposase RayT
MNSERKHIRLTDWDYSSEGAYFITICCRERQSFFGKIEDNKMIFSEIGLIASNYWLEIPYHFPHVKLDEFVTMPNHIHGIIILDYSLVGTRHGVSLQSTSCDIVGSCHGMTHSGKLESNQNINQFSKPLKNSVSVIINQYKSSVKRWCNKNGSDNFQWQNRFHDQILHHENSIDNVREYILNNPKRWTNDEFYN